VLTAFCDLERVPVSYDVVTWIVRAMMERDARKCSRLHVVFVPKEDGLGGFSRHWGPHDEHAARWRLWHIAIPACVLAGATVTLAPSRDFAKNSITRLDSWWWPEERSHLAAPIMSAARAGVSIPKLRASPAARRYVSEWLLSEQRPVVTLTIRRQANDQARNSSREEWSKLAAWLASSRCVVWLDDTNDALSQGRGFAELDLDLRLALYERAVMNIVGNNGPAALLWHSAAPYLRVAAGEPSDWSENLGLAQGEQVPWADQNQVLAYSPATFESMRDAFQRLEEQWKR
jgi:hypothetical protein